MTYKLGVYPVVTEYGYTDTPGRWDHWPAGFLFTGGADDGVDGKVVVDRATSSSRRSRSSSPTR